jgi:hypothetical protein
MGVIGGLVEAHACNRSNSAGGKYLKFLSGWSTRIAKLIS